MDHRIFNVLMVDGEGRREGKRKNRKLGSPAVFLFVCFLFVCFLSTMAVRRWSLVYMQSLGSSLTIFS